MAHRLISDLSVFASRQSRQNILVAGDLNVLHDYGEHDDAYWAFGTKLQPDGGALFQSQAQISTRQEPYPNGLEMPQA